MKKKIMIFMLGFLLVGVNAMAADGDLIVDGKLGIGITGSPTGGMIQILTPVGDGSVIYAKAQSAQQGMTLRFDSPNHLNAQFRSFSDTSWGYPTMQLLRGGGSLDNKTGALNGYVLGAFSGRGWAGGEGHEGASVRFEATENWTYNSHGTRFSFYTSPNGQSAYSAPVERLKIDHNGNVGLGTTTPQSTLQVNGYVQLALTSDAVPPTTDCDAVSELGRMIVDNVNGFLYICVDSGWVQK